MISTAAFFIALTLASPADQGRLYLSDATRAALSRYGDCARGILLKTGNALSETTASQAIEACSGDRASFATAIAADVNAVQGVSADIDREAVAAGLVQRFDRTLLDDLQGLTHSLLRLRASNAKARAKVGSE